MAKKNTTRKRTGDPHASATGNGRLFAIGDIHGCVDELAAMLRAIAPIRGDTVVFVGDYVDRGPAARDVIDAVAVRVQWHHAVGVLEQADVIGQPLQVTELRVGVSHTTEAVTPGPRGTRSGEDTGDGDDPELVRETKAERFRRNLNTHQRRT